MRVKIGYTVELGEVEDEVKELLGKALDNLEVVSQSLEQIYNYLGQDTLDRNGVLHDIEQCRSKLLKVDSTADDCHEILQGYFSILEKLEAQENNEQP